MKKVQEMSEIEFVNAFLAADENEMVAENISKKYTSEEGGYFFVAMEGDCDGADTINYWFESEADENGYVERIDARI